MRKVSRIIEVASCVSTGIAACVILGIIGLTIIEVVTRYVLHSPLILCDEFGGYSLAAIVFLGLAYCAKEKGHIRITFLVSLMPASMSNWLRVVTLTIALVYVGLASKVSYDFIVNAFQRNIRSTTVLMTPVGWVGMIMPIGFVLLFLVLIVEIAIAIRNIRTGVITESLSEEKAEKGDIWV